MDLVCYNRYNKMKNTIKCEKYKVITSSKDNSRCLRFFVTQLFIIMADLNIYLMRLSGDVLLWLFRYNFWSGFECAINVLFCDNSKYPSESLHWCPLFVLRNLWQWCAKVIAHHCNYKYFAVCYNYCTSLEL